MLQLTKNTPSPINHLTASCSICMFSIAGIFLFRYFPFSYRIYKHTFVNAIIIQFMQFKQYQKEVVYQSCFQPFIYHLCFRENSKLQAHGEHTIALVSLELINHEILNSHHFFNSDYSISIFQSYNAPRNSLAQLKNSLFTYLELI